jgi:hypothetical protein
MIVKITNDQLLPFVVGVFYCPSNKTAWTLIPKFDQTFPSGKVALSIKCGKRRKLVKGTIVLVRESVRSERYGSELTKDYIFVTGDRLGKLVQNKLPQP